MYPNICLSLRNYSLDVISMNNYGCWLLDLSLNWDQKLKERLVSILLDSLKACHKALEIENFHNRNIFSSPIASKRSNHLAKRTLTYEGRDASVTNSCRNISDIECHNYYSKGHIAAWCPHRTLTLDHETKTLPSMTSRIVRPRSMSLGTRTIMSKDKAMMTNFMGSWHVFLFAIMSNDEWKRICIFHTYMKCEDAIRKVIIDGRQGSPNRAEPANSNWIGPIPN